MSEMIERVRVVIDDWISRNVEDEAVLARRVIEAMREPTETMRAAGQRAQFEPGALPPVTMCVGANFLASEVYQAMIAAALCGPEGHRL
jgi:hypothetical protein